MLITLFEQNFHEIVEYQKKLIQFNPKVILLRPPSFTTTQLSQNRLTPEAMKLFPGHKANCILSLKKESNCLVA